MSTLYTPQGEEVANIPKADLNSFLESRGLVARRKNIGTDTFVVFDQALAPKLELGLSDKIEVRGNYGTFDELASYFRGAAARGMTALYAPKLRSARHYYTLAVFVDRMNEIAASLPELTIVVPAGDYGDRWIFGIGPQ